MPASSLTIACLVTAVSSVEANQGNFSLPISASESPRMTVPLVTFTASTVGNLLAIFVIWRNQRRSEKPSVFYTLVMTLAILDLVSTLLASPLTFIFYTTGKSVLELGGKPLCYYSGVMMIYFGIASMATVFTMSIERLIAIRFAFFYHTKVNVKKTKIAVLAILAFFLVFSSLPLIGFGDIHQQPPGSWCFINWRSKEIAPQAFNLVIVAMGILMMGGTVFCNVYVVIRVIQKRRKMRVRNSTIQVMSKRRLRKIAVDETQMMVLLGVMTCVFILCYLPLLLRISITQITAIYSDKVEFSKWNLFAVHMASINPVLDPWVYILCRRSTILRFLKLTKLMMTGKCTKEDVTALVASGREYKRRASVKNLQLSSTCSTTAKPNQCLLPDAKSHSQQVGLKFGQKWRNLAKQASTDAADINDKMKPDGLMKKENAENDRVLSNTKTM